MQMLKILFTLKLVQINLYVNSVSYSKYFLQKICHTAVYFIFFVQVISLDFFQLFS